MFLCTVAKAPVDFCNAAVDCRSAADAYAQARSTKPTACAKPTLSLELPSGGAPPQLSVQQEVTLTNYQQLTNEQSRHQAEAPTAKDTGECEQTVDVGLLLVVPSLLAPLRLTQQFLQL